MTADRERWRRVREALEAALELEGPARRRFLDQACGEDAALRAEVEELIRRESEAPPDFMVPPSGAEQGGGRAAAIESGLEPSGTGEAPGPGSVLGDFRLLRELGRGGMGTVYLARQTGLERDVAVKVVSRTGIGAEQERERFRREARAAARLDHPNIARVLAEGVDGGVAWFALEYVDGPTLADELRDRRRDESDRDRRLPDVRDVDYVRRIAECVRGVASALAHAHAHGVVHRDVKPSNVLLTPQGTAKLVDFGVARDAQMGTITRSDQLLGSLPYMSPEQARVVKDPVDERTDVYSAGVLLYEMLTRRRPFEGTTTHEVLTKIRFAEPRPVRSVNPRVPLDLATVCERAMAKELGARYPSATELRDDLDRFLDGRPIRARRTRILGRATRYLSRRRRSAALAASVLTAVCATWIVAAQTRAHAPSATLMVQADRGTQLSLAWIDPRTGQPGEATRLGEGPLTRDDVSPGVVRIDVLPADGGPPMELTRWLETDRVDPVETRFNRSPDAGSTEDMLFFDRGTLRVEPPLPESPGAEPPRRVSPLAGMDVEVEPFWLDVYEVSVGDYRAFLTARPDVEPPAFWSLIDSNRLPADRPMTNVTWPEAQAFAEWKGKRLPTHAEWMWAARGKPLRRTPWDPALGWIAASTCEPIQGGGPEDILAWFLAHSAGVRALRESRTPEGLYHMLGNAAEWTETPWIDVQRSPPRPEPQHRIECGGSWTAELIGQQLHSIGHWTAGPQYRSIEIGFRCAKSAP